jgi:methyl-accepting chemotaxis protein
MSCHGNPVNSPWHNGKDILGYQMENMKDGDLKGTFTVISSLAPVQAAVQASTMNIMVWSLIITFLSLILGFSVIRKPIATINTIVGNLSETASEVTSISGKVASTSEQLSSGANQQASALQQTSASMEEVRSMVGKNSENARNSSEMATVSQQTAERGKTVVQRMIDSIAEIDQSNHDIMAQVEKGNQRISQIIDVIADIGNKTKVINDIVFQTKLLSFNASVEAARAGEHGKGFAVVAEEVGTLAQMSGKSAAEISSMLEESKSKVDLIVQETKQHVERLVQSGKSKIQTGTAIAHECGEVLSEIVSGAQNVNGLVNEISMASHEQSEGVNEISKAIHQLDQVTQQNANLSSDIAGTADQLLERAQGLRQAVTVLTGTLKGSDSENSIKSDSTKKRSA